MENQNTGNRVAVITMIVTNKEAATKLNAVLHTNENHIVGRMGLPRVRDNVSVITVVLDAPQEEIAAISGKLGNIDGVSAKTAYAK